MREHQAPDIRTIVEAFDARAPTYARNGWHLRSAERLVELTALRPGAHVLDAATGTGFAALAAARAVGPGGRVLGVDISPGMLREARKAASASGLANLELIEADVTNLAQCPPGSFDAVTCATAILYMPVRPALREFRRLLKPGGLLAFSTMHAGSPVAGRLFRSCAGECGVTLQDPCEPLGTTEACRTALADAGFDVTAIVSETVEFSPEDLAMAWESNSRSAAYEAVRSLSATELAELKTSFLEALAAEERRDPGALSRASMLYVLARS